MLSAETAATILELRIKHGITENVWATPEQQLTVLLELPRDAQLELVALWDEQRQQSHTCLIANHQGRLEQQHRELVGAGRERARLLEELSVVHAQLEEERRVARARAAGLVPTAELAAPAQQSDEVGGDPCGELEPGDETLPLAVGAADPEQAGGPPSPPPPPPPASD